MKREAELLADVESESQELCKKILKSLGTTRQIVAMNALYMAMQLVSQAGYNQAAERKE